MRFVPILLTALSTLPKKANTPGTDLAKICWKSDLTGFRQCGNAFLERNKADRWVKTLNAKHKGKITHWASPQGIGSPIFSKPAAESQARNLNQRSSESGATLSSSFSTDTIVDLKGNGKAKASEGSGEIKSPAVKAQKKIENLLALAKGNFGAISVITKLNALPNGNLALKALKDADITGAKIWIGYRDHCREDIQAFAQKIIAKDPAMLNQIKEAEKKGWC